jgi:thiol-disulfide isomerase/thioredoxin
MKRTLAFLAALMVCLAVEPSRVAAGAPDVRVVDLKGLDAVLAGHRGQAILLNFWAIWCEPCVAEMPELVEVGRQFRGKNAVVLTVSYDLMIPDVTPEGVLEQMRAFLAQKKLDMPVFIYNAPDYDAINARFGLPGPVPVTVAIDRHGTIVARHAGRGGRERFLALMKMALGV